MTEDFYCDEVLSGKTKVNKVFETENVLAYHHTRPFWPVHIFPKKAYFFKGITSYYLSCLV